MRNLFILSLFFSTVTWIPTAHALGDYVPNSCYPDLSSNEQFWENKFGTSVSPGEWSLKPEKYLSNRKTINGKFEFAYTTRGRLIISDSEGKTIASVKVKDPKFGPTAIIAAGIDWILAHEPHDSRISYLCTRNTKGEVIWETPITRPDAVTVEINSLKQVVVRDHLEERVLSLDNGKLISSKKLPALPAATLSWINQNSANDGEILIRPSDFFQPNVPGFPETRRINMKVQPWLRNLIHQAEKEGIAIRIGTGNERTQFELYLPIVTTSYFMLPPNLGAVRSTIQNSQYFVNHDLMHQIMGRPRYLPEELSTPEKKNAAIKRMTQTLLEKEVAATYHSAVLYTPEWYKQRDLSMSDQTGIALHPEYEKLNTGWYAALKTQDRDIIRQALVAFVLGDTKKYFKLLSSFIKPSYITYLRETGVTIAQPDFTSLGKFLDGWINYITTAIAEPLMARYRLVGAKGFYDYSRKQAETMSEPWFVEWTTRFEEGHTMDEIAKTVKEAIEKITRDEPVGASEAVSAEEFNHQFTLRQISLFGRRLIEFREMAALDANQKQRVNEALDTTVDVHHALKKRELSQKDAEKRIAALMTLIQKEFPIHQFIPNESRLPDISYENYWNHPVSMAVGVYGHNAQGFNPSGLRAFQAKKNSARPSVFSKTLTQFVASLGIAQVDDDKFMDAITVVHQQDQKNARHDVEPAGRNERNTYLRKNAEVKEAIRHQIEKNLLPQLIEYSSIDRSIRANYISEVSRYKDLILKFSDIDSATYSSVFLNEERPLSDGSPAPKVGEKDYHILKKRFIMSVELVFRGAFKVLSASNKNRGKVIVAEHAFLKKINDYLEKTFASNDFVSEMPDVTPMEYLKLSFPVDKVRWRATWDFAKMILKGRYQKKDPNFGDALRSLQPKNWLRNGQKDIVYSNFSPEKIQDDGVYTFVLNHDYATFDPMAWLADIVRRGEFDDFYLLTTRVHYSPFGADATDPNVLYIEDDWKKQLVERIKTRSGKKIAVFLYADGMVPFFSFRIPLPAFSGSFRAQKTLVKELSGMYKVYQVLGRTNGLDHLTGDQVVNLEAYLQEPQELTPSMMTNEFVMENRLKVEEFLNFYRGGGRSIDLLKPHLAIGTQIPAQSELLQYLPYSIWLTEKTLGRAYEIWRNPDRNQE